MWIEEIERNGWVCQVFSIAFMLKLEEKKLENAKPNTDTSENQD
jgi:hypothetical protein